MKDLLLYILKNIPTQPEEINVDEKDDNGLKEFIITAHPDDVGRVIGKNGRIIKAIRTIMRVTAIQRDERVKVTVISDVEEEGGQEDEIEEGEQPKEELSFDEELESEEDLETEETEESTAPSEQTESQTDSPQPEDSDSEETTLDLDL